jgi:hypothetical protein
LPATLPSSSCVQALFVGGEKNLHLHNFERIS